MTPETLQALIREADADALWSALEQIDGNSQGTLAKTALESATKLGNEVNDSSRRDGETWDQCHERRLRTVQQICGAWLATYRLGSWPDIQKLERTNYTPNLIEFEKLLERLLPHWERQPPAWLENWVTYLLDRRPGGFQWSWVRRLMRAGVVSRPTTDNYILRMPTDVEYLRTDPEAIQDELFGWFRLLPRHKGALIPLGDIDRAAESDSVMGSLAGTLRALVEEGLIERPRLLTASLEALQLGRRPVDCTWYYQFHEYLRPTLDERSSLQPLYCDLLLNDVPAVTSFALAALDELSKAGRLDRPRLLTAVERVFALPTKGTAVAALKLLGQVAKQDPESKAEVGVVSAAGLAHEVRDVQQAALRVLEGLKLKAEPRVAAAVVARLDAVATTLKERVEKLLASLGGATSMGATSGPTSKPARDVRPSGGVLATSAAHAESAGPKTTTAPTRLAPEHAITPIATLDELIDAAAAFIEQFRGADELERLLDGLSRLCDERPEDFAKRTAPLFKRIEKLRNDGRHPAEIELDLIGRMMQLLRTWFHGEPGPRSTTTFEHDLEEAPPPEPRLLEEPSAAELEESYSGRPRRVLPLSLAKRLGGVGALTFLQGRLKELSGRLRGCDARHLLAAPTHRGGWLAPAAFVERLRVYEQLGLDPQSCDLRQALLRLAPDQRDETLAAASGLSGSRQRALDWALGRLRPTAITEVGVYVAAEAGRNPTAPMLASENPTVLEPLRFTWNAVRQPRAGDSMQQRWGLNVVPNLNAFTNPLFRIPPLTLCAVANRADEITWVHGKAECLSQIWPLLPDPFFAAGAVAIVGDLETTSNDVRHHADFLRPLFDPEHACGEMGQLLLSVSMLAKSSDLRGLAVDALIGVLSDGRCEGPELGEVLRRLLPSGMVRCNRLAESLVVAARTGGVCARACARLVMALFSELDSLPDDAHHLLTPLQEWLAETGELLAGSTRAVLETTQGASKLAKLAKALLRQP